RDGHVTGVQTCALPIWKTTDAGKTWTKLQGNGLPEGLLGRIGIDVCRSNPNVVYAQIEVGASTGTGGEEPVVGGGQGGASPTPKIGRASCRERVEIVGG